MLRLVGLVCLLVSVASAHDVIGMIINSTPYYMDLTTSDVKHGHVENIPAIRLAPYQYTNFTMSSHVDDDHIEYKFAYTPETVWCPDYDPSKPMTAVYDYAFGSNSCSGSSVTCDSTSEVMTLNYNECSTFYGTSKPTYTITKTKFSK